MEEIEDSSPYTPIPQRVFTSSNGSSNQDYSCTYPLRIEHVGMVEKGKDRDRERDQGQPKTRASPKKIEKEAKKTRGCRRYILLLFVELAQRSPLLVFLFLFFKRL